MRPLYFDRNLEQSEASYKVGEEEVNNSDSDVEEGQLEPTFAQTSCYFAFLKTTPFVQKRICPKKDLSNTGVAPSITLSRSGI